MSVAVAASGTVAIVAVVLLPARDYDLEGSRGRSSTEYLGFLGYVMGTCVTLAKTSRVIVIREVEGMEEREGRFGGGSQP